MTWTRKDMWSTQGVNTGPCYYYICAASDWTHEVDPYVVDHLHLYTQKSIIWIQTDSGSYNHWLRMVRPPADHFFANQNPLQYGPWIVFIINHTQINTRKPPYENISPYILAFILCSNTPSMKSLKKNCWNICRSVGYMSGAKLLDSGSTLVRLITTL